jgi:putative membrane protein
VGERAYGGRDVTDFALPPAASSTDRVAHSLRDPLTIGILVAGVVLWWACAYHEASLPALAPWEFSFSWFYATAFTVRWYCRGIAQSSAAERPGAWRIACFAIGVTAIYAVLQTRFEYLAQHMFFLNRAQHVVMHHLGPLFVSLAWPWATIRRGMPAGGRRLTASRTVTAAMHIMRQPLIAAFFFVGLIALWLYPPVHFRAMLDPDLYLVMNWSMVADGLLFWSLVLDPRPRVAAGVSFGTRAALAIGVMFPQIAIGAVIALSRHDLYAFYAWCGRIYPSTGALDDQNYGGLIVWIPPAMMSVVALLLVLNALRLAEEAAQQHPSAIDPSRWTGR